MSDRFEIAVIVGSLRKGSFTRKVVRAMMQNAPASLHCRFVEIGDLPLYNEDMEGHVTAWSRFRTEIAAVDGVLFATPEYNRSIPGCLKNAIDVGSRPQGKNVWDGKAAAVVSVTPYNLGGVGANYALRQALLYINMPVMQQPEGYISGAGDLVNDDGSVKKEETRKFLASFMSAFAQWVAKITSEAKPGSFDEFMKRREEAANAYVNGNGAPVNSISAKSGDATFFPPNGGRVSGAGAVAARYDSDVHAFSPKGTTSFEILQSGASGVIAYWTGLQPAQVNLGGKPMAMTLRITELFRLIDGEWKMIHRHADPAVEPQKK